MLALVLKVRVLQLKSHRNVIYRYVILQHFLVRISRFCHQRQGPLSSSEEEVQCNWLKVREITVHARAYVHELGAVSYQTQQRGSNNQR